MRDIDVGEKITVTANSIRREIDHICRQHATGDISGMNGMIMGFLSIHQDREIFQKDIETELSLTKSTVSIILRRMEEKGFIKRQSVSSDKRLKKIMLTPAAEDAYNQLQGDILTLEERICACLTPEEKETLIHTLTKIQKSL